jgi:hypothetical protein
MFGKKRGATYEKFLAFSWARTARTLPTIMLPLIGFSEANADNPPVFIDDEAVYGLVQHSVLTISDQVDGNCWTNSSSARAKVRLLFEQNDIFVPDYQPAFFGLSTVHTQITGIGFRLENGLCVVSAEFEVLTLTRIPQVERRFHPSDGQ